MQEFIKIVSDPFINKLGISKAISAKNRIDFLQAKEICSSEFFKEFIQKEAEEEYFQRIIGQRIKHSKIKLYLEAYKKIRGYGWSAIGKTIRYHNTEKDSLQIIIPKNEMLRLTAINVFIAIILIGSFVLYFKPIALSIANEAASIWPYIILQSILLVVFSILMSKSLNLFLKFWYAVDLKKELNN